MEISLRGRDVKIKIESGLKYTSVDVVCHEYDEFASI
jgi:hypothetical protein